MTRKLVDYSARRARDIANARVNAMLSEVITLKEIRERLYKEVDTLADLIGWLESSIEAEKDSVADTNVRQR